MKKKYHLINWKMVKNPKDRGGLGIRDLAMMNVAMGVKLLWRMITGKPSWWKKVLWRKYFQRNKEKMLRTPA
jgi:hypothetical protein